MTREEWLRHAVEKLDAEIFEGDLDTTMHGFQINCGVVPGKKLTSVIQPYDGEDVKLEDFFPTTISVSHTIKDPIQMLENLTYICIFAFFNENKVNKRSKALLKKYNFEEPFRECTPSDYLKTLIKSVYNMMVKEYGEFPGEPVIIHPKEKKETKKNVLVMYCPNCGYEIKVSRKMHEQYGQATPTCACGAKMIVVEDEQIQDEN